MFQVSEEELQKGGRADIGSPGNYGRLTIRKNGGEFEIYEIDSGEVKYQSKNLDAVINEANNLSNMRIEKA